MWYQKNPKIINARNIEHRDYGIVFMHIYKGCVMPSERTVKRDFLIEKKRTYDIAGIAFHSYKDDLWITYNNSGIKSIITECHWIWSLNLGTNMIRML